MSREPKVAAALAAAVLAASACGNPAQSAQSGSTIDVTGDATAAAAHEAARATLPEFWKKFDAKDPALSKFSVKVALPAPDDGVEVIWMDVESREGDEIIGLLTNEPQHLPNLRRGSRISAHTSLVTDWSYEKGGKVYGNYFVRAMLDRAPPNIKAEVQATLASTPIEDAGH